MLRVLEGVISRRLLVNFRVRPEVARALVPEPLEPLTRAGAAIASVSLTRLERLRPRGLAPIVGFTIESMAHRFAISARDEEGKVVPGVFVARRDTESRLVAALGGRLFAGVNRLARFEVAEDPRRLRVGVRTEDGGADLRLEVEWGGAFLPSPAFSSLEDAARFFQDCEQGFKEGERRGELGAVRLAPIPWRVEAARVVEAGAGFFEDEKRFPAGSVELDSAIALRTLPEQWVEVRAVPEILEEPLLPVPA